MLKPILFIAGEPLTRSADLIEPTPLDEIAITWGSDDWYTAIEPAEMTVRLLDPRGQFLKYAQRENVPIELKVTTSESYTENLHTVFIGVISDIDVTYTPQQHSTGEKVFMWTAEITAVDPLARAAKHRAGAPARNDYLTLHPDIPAARKEKFEKREIWDTKYGDFIDTRVADINARAEYPFVTHYGPTWPVFFYEYEGAAAGTYGIVPSSYQKASNVSLLEVMQNTARVFHILHRVYFDPESRTFAALSPADHVSYRPDDSNGANLGRYEPEAYALDGREWEPAGGEIRESLTAVETVSQVTLKTRGGNYIDAGGDSWGFEFKDLEQSKTVIPGNPGTTLEIEIDHVALQHPILYPSWRDPLDMWQQHFFKSVWGKTRSAPVSLRCGFTQPISMKLLKAGPAINSTGSLDVYYFTHSIANALPSAGPFSFVGGELTYNNADGWTITGNPAPVPANTHEGRTPTLGDMLSDDPIGGNTDGTLIADWLHWD